MIPRSFRFFPWLFLFLSLLAGCGGGGGGGGASQNLAPVLDPIAGSQVVSVGERLSITLRASDPNAKDTVRIFTDRTSGATLSSTPGNPSSATFNWTPTSADLVSDSDTPVAVKFTASDGLLDVSQTIVITIKAPAPPPANQPPVLAPIGNKSINEGSNLSFTVSATDADGDALTLGITGLPTWASFDVATGVFSGTPGPTDLGDYTVTFSASDGKAPPVEEQIVITVVSNAPVITLTAPPPAQVTENELVTVTIAVSDPDAGDTISVSASGTALAYGGAFSYDPATQTGIFTWSPAIVTAGNYSITFAASDGTSSVATTAIIVYVRTNPLLATTAGLSGITVFNQSIAAKDGNNEVFPGQANFWDLDLDAALIDGSWDQFDGNLFLTVEDNFTIVGFPADQTYPELTFLTPVMTALDGIKVAAVAHHDSYAGPDPRAPIAATAGEGNYSAWLNATADSRLQQLIDLQGATAPVVLSVEDQVLAQVGEFKSGGNLPYYRIVLRDPTTGGLLQTLFEPPLSSRSAVEWPRATHNATLDPALLGRKVLLSFELRAANGTLFNTVTGAAEYYGSYARIDNVSIQDSTGEFIQNGNFESGNLNGWTTNAARESQNIRFGKRTVNELEVTRHFYAAPDQLWARWVDVFENTTSSPLVKTINLHSILGAWGGAVVYPHPGAAPPDIHALTIWDTGAGDRSLRDLDTPNYRDSGLVFGNASGVNFASTSSLTGADGDDFIDIQHVVIVPPGGRVTLVHFTILSGESTGKTATSTAARAATIDAERDKILNNFWTDPRYRDGMTQQQIDSIQNF